MSARTARALAIAARHPSARHLWADDTFAGSAAAAGTRQAASDDTSPVVTRGELSETVNAINDLAERLRVLKGGGRG